MIIHVRGALMFHQLLGDQQPVHLEVPEGATIVEVLQLLAGTSGASFGRLVFEAGTDDKVKSGISFVVNGFSHWNLAGQLNHRLTEGDELLLPMLTGG
ncbi:MAG: MoaD/ThiS family protein [Desulfopila sp.]